MIVQKSDIHVFAHWQGMEQAKALGILTAQQAKGRQAFGFAYQKEWIQTNHQFLLDPDLEWFSGPQFPLKKNIFGVFMDSMPDTWGRTLMQRREALQAKEEGRAMVPLTDLDLLLGVSDQSRMGALRFKLNIDGPFLDNSNTMPIPPWNHIFELQKAAKMLETDTENKQVKKWMAILLAPGSSLGGARPKANVMDGKRHLWIAKFPSKSDIVDKAAWEYLAYQLALGCGIEMSESKIEKVTASHHTFFTKRFDRAGSERIHFSSAMTMTCQTEESIKSNPPSYLDLAEFIQYHGARNQVDLAQLWRRMVFNIAISNTDDHLRNHGFLLTPKGWVLSPAFDLNPSIDKNGLSLNINTTQNDLDFDLAKSVGEYFQLSENQMCKILNDVRNCISKWKSVAKSLGISRSEQQLMEVAFRF